MNKICLIFSALISFLVIPSLAAKTSIYYKGGVLSLDQPEIRINKVYGIRLAPKNVIIKIGDKVVFIPHYIENVSNATNTVKLEVRNISKSNGWTAEILKDDNGDGVHQFWDNDRLGPTVNLGEGTVLHFFLKMKRADDARPGDNSSAVIKVSGTIKDGSGYTGYNGIIYGGEDEAESTDTVIVE